MKKIGFIGCGNMGGAILMGALACGTLAKEQVYVYDVSAAVMERMDKLGVNTVGSVRELCEKSDMIVAAVKPQFAKETLASAGDMLDGKCILSIMAGITSLRLKEMVTGEVRVLRCMPNTPAMVNEGAFALCSDTDALPEEKAMAQEIFSNLGIVEWVRENLIDAVCGVSGSGPAYVAMFIEAMADGGVLEGLPRATAYKLAAQTVVGTGKMILEKGYHPGELKDMVCSPAGTTIAGCLELEQGGMRAAVTKAVIASAEKSKNM